MIQLTRRRRALLALSSLAMLVLSACAGPDRLGIESETGELPQNALDPAGPIAQDIDDLWWLVFTIAAVIFVVVQVALVYAIVRFRRRKGEERLECPRLSQRFRVPATAVRRRPVRGG